MTRPAEKSPEVVGEQLTELATCFQLRTVAAELVHRVTQAGQAPVRVTAPVSLDTVLSRPATRCCSSRLTSWSSSCWP